MNSSEIPGRPSQAQPNALAILNHIFERMSTWPPSHDLQSYRPLSTDFIVTTYPKAGTTLVQYLSYQVLVQTGTIREREFTEINDVAPWIDWHIQMRTPLPTEQPRIFKSHSPKLVFDEHAKGKPLVQKHIVVIRSPLDYPSSWLDFLVPPLTDDLAAPDDLYGIDDPAVQYEMLCLFARHRLLQSPLDPSHRKDDESCCEEIVKAAHSSQFGWFKHANSWISPEISPNILILFYEDVISNLELTAKRIADFIGITISDTQKTKVAYECSRKNMANDPRFECHSEARVFGYRYGVKKSMEERKYGFKAFNLPVELIHAINKRFQEMFGVNDYCQFMEMVNEKQRQQFNR